MNKANRCYTEQTPIHSSRRWGVGFSLGNMLHQALFDLGISCTCAVSGVGVCRYWCSVKRWPPGKPAWVRNTDVAGAACPPLGSQQRSNTLCPSQKCPLGSAAPDPGVGDMIKDTKWQEEPTCTLTWMGRFINVTQALRGRCLLPAVHHVLVSTIPVLKKLIKKYNTSDCKMFLEPFSSQEKPHLPVK